jgi:hypothetical protein
MRKLNKGIIHRVIGCLAILAIIAGCIVKYNILADSNNQKSISITLEEGKVKQSASEFLNAFYFKNYNGAKPYIVTENNISESEMQNKKYI